MISMTEKYHCSFFHVLRISLPWKRTRCVDWDGGVCFILFGRSEIKVEWRMRDVLCWHGDHEGSVQRYTLGGRGVGFVIPFSCSTHLFLLLFQSDAHGVL